ncbi:MAG TPA: hypothetical protein VMM78_19465 [Thermomicrobiales bacterium]|nr:hypothetical protein [Thermomicrobiales bacterium]
MGLPRVVSYGAFESRSERARAITFDLCRYMRVDRRGMDMAETMSMCHWVFDHVAAGEDPVDLATLSQRWSSRAESRDDHEWLQRAFR